MPGARAPPQALAPIESAASPTSSGLGATGDCDARADDGDTAAEVPPLNGAATSAGFFFSSGWKRLLENASKVGDDLARTRDELLPEEVRNAARQSFAELAADAASARQRVVDRATQLTEQEPLTFAEVTEQLSAMKERVAAKAEELAGQIEPTIAEVHGKAWTSLSEFSARTDEVVDRAMQRAADAVLNAAEMVDDFQPRLEEATMHVERRFSLIAASAADWLVSDDDVPFGHEDSFGRSVSSGTADKALEMNGNSSGSSEGPRGQASREAGGTSQAWMDNGMQREVPHASHKLIQTASLLTEHVQVRTLSGTAQAVTSQAARAGDGGAIGSGPPGTISSSASAPASGTAVSTVVAASETGAQAARREEGGQEDDEDGDME